MHIIYRKKVFIVYIRNTPKSSANEKRGARVIHAAFRVPFSFMDLSWRQIPDFIQLLYIPICVTCLQLIYYCDKQKHIGKRKVRIEIVLLANYNFIYSATNACPYIKIRLSFGFFFYCVSHVCKSAL